MTPNCGSAWARWARIGPRQFAGKPGQSEFLILHGGDPAAWQRKAAKEEKLRVLIDKVLAAHGGEDKLNKLQFTMTVKHSNGETQHYFVQPPKNFRWETTHPDRTGKRIVILFPEGRTVVDEGAERGGEGVLPDRYRTPGGILARLREVLRPPAGAAAEGRRPQGGPAGRGGQDRRPCRRRRGSHRPALQGEDVLRQGDAPARQGTADSYYRSQGFIVFSDYKKFDGIPIAQKEKDGHSDRDVTDFRAVDKFDAKLFEQP